MTTLGIPFFLFRFFMLLATDFGWNHTIDSTILAISLIAYSLDAILAGFAVSRIEFRNLCVVGSLTVGLGTLAPGGVANFFTLLIAFAIIMSIGSSFLVIAATAIVVKWFIKARGLAVGLTSAGAGFGFPSIPLFRGTIDSTRRIEAFIFFLLGFSFLMILVGSSYFMQHPPR